MTKDAATGLTGNAVEYYLDGVKQADLVPYVLGFNAPGSREVWVVGAVPKWKTIFSVCKSCWNGRRTKLLSISRNLRFLNRYIGCKCWSSQYSGWYAHRNRTR